MLNKILAFAVLSLALLMQPARAETQKSDKEKDSFIQNLSTLNQQQKAQLLDEVVRGVNERYVQLPETDVLQSMRLSHDFPQKEQLTYTIQFQPALRPVLDRNRERFVQIVETGRAVLLSLCYKRCRLLAVRKPKVNSNFPCEALHTTSIITCALRLRHRIIGKAACT